MKTSLIQDLTSALHNDHIQDLSKILEAYACVVILLRGPRENLEIGYIQRAHHPNDRWSGQIAFPGGKREDIDESDLHTALRETREEIGVDLDVSCYVGRLDDIQGRKGGQILDFFIRPFVFYLEKDVELNLAPEEVADFFWFPLRELKNPSRQTTHPIQRENIQLQLPAIDVNHDLPLWGLTYFMTQNLLTHLADYVSE
ncbi:NUDIX hydrolase [Bdellovibrio sp. HCB2-146]|uniref:NUDIX hydrolase n=1 Tax=Bdellovibrio sp. HCB2-146 TaxID=3394362 RepID=UPI0039BD35A8